ncbi:MAG: hypothetical protein QM796_01620 [Chthoniobacteraceae bacterium]
MAVGGLRRLQLRPACSRHSLLAASAFSLAGSDGRCLRHRLRPAVLSGSRGFYLAVSTLAAQFFVQWALNKFNWFSNDNPSGVIDAPALVLFGINFDSSAGRYLLTLTIVTLLTASAAGLVWM